MPKAMPAQNFFRYMSFQALIVAQHLIYLLGQLNEGFTVKCCVSFHPDKKLFQPAVGIEPLTFGLQSNLPYTTGDSLFFKVRIEYIILDGHGFSN